MQVIVEVAHPRRQGKRLNARSFGAFGQCRERHVTGGIGVAHDVEPTQCVREQDGSEVVGGECCRHRHVGQNASERQDRLDALAGRHHVARHAETHGVAEEVAHRPSRCVDRRLAAPSLGEAARVEPSAMRAGQMTGEVVTDAIIAGQVSVEASSSGR
jgi:hypothetical protein